MRALPPFSGGLDFCDGLEVSCFNLHPPHAELLHLAASRHGETLHETDVLRDFEVSNFPPAKLARIRDLQIT